MDKKQKPIILNTEMVKAVLSGRKICTRRPVKSVKGSHISNTVDTSGKIELFNADEFGDAWSEINPPYQKDDILYVRETHAMGMSSKDGMAWKASSKWDDFEDGSPEDFDNIKWTPSIHMPKWASRIKLKVTNVRAERLFDMTEAEAEKEGVEKFGHILALDKFKTLWNSLYNNWDSNPYVWVIDFEVVKL